jgi:hypothetical protein
MHVKYNEYYSISVICGPKSAKMISENPRIRFWKTLQRRLYCNARKDGHMMDLRVKAIFILIDVYYTQVNRNS